MSRMRDKREVSRAQGYKLVKRAWAQIKDDIDETGIDRQGCCAGLSRRSSPPAASLEAEEPRCCGGLHPQLDHMTGTGYNSHRGYGIHRRTY